MYHLWAQGKLLVPPLFQFRVAATKVSGIVRTPALLSRLFTGAFTFLPGTGPLTITDTAVRNKKTAAEFTTLGHGHLRNKYPETVLTTLHWKCGVGKMNIRKESKTG